MCWNHVVWCCFHWEKRKKQKKTRRFWKSFTSYLCNGSTLEHNSNWFGKLQSSATTFVFWPFLVIGHVTIIPTPYQMDPDRYNHPYLVFLHFLVKPDEVSFLGYMQRTLTWTLKAVPHCVYTVYTIPIFFWLFVIFLPFFHQKHPIFLFWTSTLDPDNSTQQYWPSSPFFSDFFHILWLFFIWKHKSFHIWKYTLDPESRIPQYHYQQSAPFPYFFPDFSPILLLFSFSTASLSTFGNVHWTLKTSPAVSTIPYFFLIFPYFITIFHLAQPHFPYLEIHSEPWRQQVGPWIVSQAYIYIRFFSDFSGFFLKIFAIFRPLSRSGKTLKTTILI